LQEFSFNAAKLKKYLIIRAIEVYFFSLKKMGGLGGLGGLGGMGDLRGLGRLGGLGGIGGW
jgi:putative cuticle protein CPG45